VKASNLHDLWASPDNTRLTSKQFSFRLPTHIAAKIAALCEMYPNKTRTQVVADLLTSALDELEQGLPEALGPPIPPDEQHDEDQLANMESRPPEDYYYLGGLRAQFRVLANKHYAKFEKDLGNDAAAPLYEQRYVTESSFKKK
jgi:hypothetical protein